jgi:hypothetical protein
LDSTIQKYVAIAVIQFNIYNHRFNAQRLKESGR